jgi:hypothetical protein
MNVASVIDRLEEQNASYLVFLRLGEFEIEIEDNIDSSSPVYFPEGWSEAICSLTKFAITLYYYFHMYLCS